MKKQLLLAAICSFVLSASAQDLFPLKRQPYTLVLAMEKGKTYREDLYETNYILKDQTCQVYPGEKIFIEIEQENGVVKNVRAVAEVKYPEKTVTVSFMQIAKKKVHQSMMLHVANPFQFELKYEAKMYLPYYKKWVNTSIIPVTAGKSGIETWPDLISSISLGEWAFITSKKESVTR